MATGVTDLHGPSIVSSSSTPIALVQAEGLPNLLHELVHAVQAGRLDDDHGIDYTAIPFDLDTAAGRAMLWDELACCVISCAYLRGYGRAARAGSSPAAVQAEVDHWLWEQVEIQPVFYGLQDDPCGFLTRVGALLNEHGPEAHAVLERAYAATERALREAGADPEVAEVAWRPSFHALWPRLLQGHSAAEPR
ncbi:hypothetical protein [Paraliomyxa miuraensis]|uniref:hypothetical protein n=1 Tax=Paraliomyxa miuraensis TaxID=376150 RepID=UPI00224DBBA4|nr:hypothetical protein [Paraliomyxa miuraensis]MCX4245832.1 hypothetical protein [Paraliomyxa miuraensis]